MPSYAIALRRTPKLIRPQTAAAMRFRLFCALQFLPVIGYAAAALPIEFNGVLIQEGKTTVSLLNPNTGTAKWVAIGGTFDTYAVTSYIPDPSGCR